MENLTSYPRGWEWLKTVPTEDFNWLIEILSTMTDDTDTYDFVTYTDDSHLVKNVRRKNLAEFMNNDLGMELGISTHEHYIICKALEINSEEDYLSSLSKIRRILGINKKHPIPSNRRHIKLIKEQILNSLDSLEKDLDLNQKHPDIIEIQKLEIKITTQNNTEIYNL